MLRPRRVTEGKLTLLIILEFWKNLSVYNLPILILKKTQL